MGTTTAVLIERHGPPEVLVEREVPLADPGPDEVHLEVEAAGVNFADLLMRTGIYATVPPMPYSPGFEAAGIVRRIGSGVADWRVGDRAIALIRFGGYARDLIVPLRNLFRYPATVSPADAAAVPVAFLTALVPQMTTQSLFAISRGSGPINLPVPAMKPVHARLMQIDE